MLLALSHAALLGAARWAAFVAFALLLGGLGFWLHRSRKQLARDEADAALELEFRELERDVHADRSRYD